jgi:hypothetical protein
LKPKQQANAVLPTQTETSLRYRSMAVLPKSKVTADLKKNRLMIILSAIASKVEAERIFIDIRFCVADLKPGFDVITDFSQCTLAHLNAVKTMRQIMDYLVERQPDNIIRIVGETSLVFKQLLRFTNRFQSYKPIHVNTMEEAEAFLANSSRHSGLCFIRHRQQVRYTHNQEEGSGHLIELSTSECTVQGHSLPLSTDKQISIVIFLHQEDNTLASFTFTAQVIRVQDDLFSAQFLDLDKDQKSRIYNYLAYEARQETPLG